MDTDFYAEDRATLGDRIIAAREGAGLDSHEVAQRLGVRHRTLKSWEDDATEPRSNRLQMLAGMLGVSLVWLMTGRGEGPADASRQPAAAASPSLGAELREVRDLLDTAAERLSRLEAAQPQ